MKGIVFSGIVYWPKHKHADIHGNLRIVIRTKYQLEIEAILARHKIPFHQSLFRAGIWHRSQSQVEIAASEGHYGEILTCPLVLAYLKPENYIPLGKSRKSSANLTTGTAPTPDLPVEAYRTP